MDGKRVLPPPGPSQPLGSKGGLRRRQGFKSFGELAVTFLNGKIIIRNLGLVLRSEEQGRGPSDPLQSFNPMIL